jgi:hypothetical protein
LIKASSMAITFKNKITLRPGAMFRFGTISCIADEEGTLQRIACLPEKNPSSRIPREAGARLRAAPPLTARRKMIPCRPRFRSPREKKDWSGGVLLTRKLRCPPRPQRSGRGSLERKKQTPRVREGEHVKPPFQYFHPQRRTVKETGDA